MIRISSPNGSIDREVMLNKDLSTELIFIPMAFHNNDSMQLVELTQLGEASSPGWKECNVKIEKL